MNTTFCNDSEYEKELMAVIPLMGEAPCKAENDFHGNFGHTIGLIQHINVMISTDICYMTCRLGTNSVAHILPVCKVEKRCIYFISNHTL